MRISDWSSDVCSSDLHDNDTGILSVADDGLLAVDDIAIVGAPRRGAHRLEVRPGAGLGHRKRADQFARRHARQPAIALRLGALSEDIMCDDARADIVAGADTATKTDPDLKRVVWGTRGTVQVKR